MRGAAAACSLALLLLLSTTSARVLSEEAAVRAVVARARASGGYQTTKPLIGVLTQPCHDCPGR
jgi:gamma-glutamyl hydrolase